MAYTDIPTVSVGDLYTASDFNTYLRDNFRAGIPDAFTAQGGIAFGAGADTIGVLALGTAGQWLEACSAGSLGAHWVDPPPFFDWFTFGAYSCASLDSADLGAGAQSINPTIDFGISDTTARIFLTSLRVWRYDAGAIHDDSPTDRVEIRSANDANKIWLWCPLWGSSDDTSHLYNTQSGMFEIDDTGNIQINWTAGNLYAKVTMKIWGYA